jgi:hypothetical protein
MHKALAEGGGPEGRSGESERGKRMREDAARPQRKAARWQEKTLHEQAEGQTAPWQEKMLLAREISTAR